MLLVRVAERIPSDGGKVSVPLIRNGKLAVKSFNLSDNRYDFSDSRVVSGREGKYLTSMSRFVSMYSEDGVHFEAVGRLDPSGDYEAFGIEDPRITKIGDDYFITYSAVSPRGICCVLCKTVDFINFEKLGNILPPDNKDCAIFPEKIGGKYMLLHRPSCSDFARPEIWICESPDLFHFGNHRFVCGVRRGGWDGVRIGSSSVPERIKEGWLVLYHGADEKNRYCIGALVLDAADPGKVLRRSKKPFLLPEAAYEVNGFFSNVVFSCGAVASGENMKIYYGAADQSVCLATVKIADILSGTEEVAA